MSTFLELVQKYQRDTGVTGSPVSSVVSQTGFNLKLVSWIADADQEIQRMNQDWNFLRTDFNFNTQPDKDTYSLAEMGIANFNAWKRDSFTLGKGTASYSTLYELDYKEWFHGSARLGVKVSQRPSEIVYDHDHSVVLIDQPNDIYQVDGVYFKAPTRMTANGDTSDIPVQFENLILKVAEKYQARYYEDWDMLKAANLALYNPDNSQAGLMLPLEAAELPDQESRGRASSDDDNYATVE